MEKLTFGSLFAGIGGFDFGFGESGMKCVWQVEIDKQANAVRRKHWPNVEHFEDVREFHAEDAIRPELICGGFPCQDLSVAGRRAGLAGERSGLFHEFVRILAEFRPRWVCIENVPGLYSSWSGDSPSSLGIEPGPGREMVLEQRSDLDIVTKRLGELGYRWAFRCFDAQYLGVAQRRRRVFIVGSLGDGPHPAQILFDTESLSRNPPTREKAGEGSAESIASCLNSGGNNGGFRTEPGEHLVKSFRTSGNCGAFDQGDKTAALNTATDLTQNIVCGPLQTHQTPNGHGMAGVNNQAVNSGHVVAVAFQERGRDGGREVNWQDGVAYSLNSPGNGGRRQENCVAFAQNQRGELRESEISPQFPAARTEMGVRRLTPRECERLQGFFDDFTRWDVDGNEISDSARYRMLGNAVAVPVAQWIGRRIVASIHE